MKKIFLMLLPILLITTSCTHWSEDIKNKGYNYTVIDTTHISTNGFNSITRYDVIIEVDSALYSACMNSQGMITKLDRKLIVKK